MDAKENYEAQIFIEPIVRRVEGGEEHPAVEVSFPDNAATFNFTEMHEFIHALKKVMDQAESVYTEGEYDFGKED